MDDLLDETFGANKEKGTKLSDDDENQEEKEEKQEEGAAPAEENKEPVIENEMTLTE